MDEKKLTEELESLKARLSQLEKRTQTAEDKLEIERLMSKYQFYFAAGEGGRIVDELWAHEADDVANEFGASGVYAGLRCVATAYQKDVLPGKMNVHTMTTPYIEIAGDGKTAKGVWMSIGAEMDAGDLGPNPPKSLEARKLLTSETADGKRFKAEWMWQKFEVEFIRENGVWKIWHLHGYDIFRCPYDENWVTWSTKRFELDGLGIDALYTSNIPYRPDEPHENNATMGTSFHWQYKPDAAPVLEPAPPEPYETFEYKPGRKIYPMPPMPPMPGK